MKRLAGLVDGRDVLGVIGVGALVYGIGLWSVPAAWMTFGGLALLAWAGPYLLRWTRKG